MVLTMEQKHKITMGLLEAYKIGTEVGLTNSISKDTEKMIHILLNLIECLETTNQGK